MSRYVCQPERMSGRRRLLLAGVLAGLLLAAAIGVYLEDGSRTKHEGRSVMSSPATRAGGFFGVNAQALFDLPARRVEAHLAVMADSGLELVRRDASWNVAEPEPPEGGRHSYQWDRFDREVVAYARHGLRWLPIVDYSTAWSGEIEGDFFSAPAHVGDYAAYAGALADRYGKDGSFWREHPRLPQLPVTRFEIWNEPNAALFWHPTERAAERYAELYLAAHAAIRHAVPSARVLVGGLAPGNGEVLDAQDFVATMVRHRPELVGAIDAIAFHPYAATADSVIARIRDFRQTLERVGLEQVPLEITEVGWTTTTTSESERAEALRQLAEQLPRSDCSIASLIPHTWLTAERDPNNPEDWFGIYNADTTPKPSGSAYITAVRRARSRPRAATLAICGSRD
jgi:polysaccharide biosynthesis protein PslG